MTKKNSILLDVDPSLLENNLLLRENDDEFDQLFPKKKDVSWKCVDITPGFCVKTRRSEEDTEHPGGKVFVNVCHTTEIPAPEDIDEERLMKLWNAASETCEYRVPMSLGEARDEPDKAGRPSTVYDVAINTSFFDKVQHSKLFMSFVLEVILQGVQEKYSISIEPNDYVILKNRKCMGNPPAHKVRCRDSVQAKPATPLIQELGTQYSSSTSSAPQSQALSKARSQSVAEPGPNVTSGAANPSPRKPDFRLLQQPASGEPRRFLAQIWLPDVMLASEVSLDVGEDRVILESSRRGYLLDVFLPKPIRQDAVVAKFNTEDKLLTLSLPIETSSAAC